MRLIVLDDDQFEERFEPELAGESWKQYPTHGHEEYLEAARVERRLWTAIDADGELFLSSGFHFVNRLYYIVTKRPYPAGADYQVSL